MQNILEIILIIVIGLCIGSFITMASFRFAVDNKKIKDLIFNRSACPSCGNELKVKNLIPVFSWLYQKGKCSFCRKNIPVRYPLIEVSSAITFLIIFLSVGQIFSIKLLLLFLMATLLLIMIVTDLEHYFIPDVTQIVLFCSALIYHLVVKSKFGFLYYFISAGLFLAFALALHYGFLLIAKKRAIGIDDIKFFIVAGFLLGLHQFPIFMIFSGGLGIIFGLIWQRIKNDETFPFAPALVASLIICLLYGDIMHKYLY